MMKLKLIQKTAVVIFELSFLFINHSSSMERSYHIDRFEFHHLNFIALNFIALNFIALNFIASKFSIDKHRLIVLNIVEAALNSEIHFGSH